MKLRLLFLLMLCFACKEVNLKKVDERALVEEELQNINWNSVDEYPTFKTCDSTSGQSSEACFKATLVAHINKALANANIVVAEDLKDTLMLKLQINYKGEISIPSIQAKKETRAAIPSLDSIMRGSMQNLPEVLPAIKRGQQVSTEFQLPVVVLIK